MFVISSLIPVRVGRAPIATLMTNIVCKHGSPAAAPWASSSTFQDKERRFRGIQRRTLIERYRLDRDGIVFVTDLVREVLENDTKRSHALTAELKVVITLIYLATGKMHLCNSDDLGISQPTVSRVISETLYALSRPTVLLRFIKFLPSVAPIWFSFPIRWCLS